MKLILLCLNLLTLTTIVTCFRNTARLSRFERTSLSAISKIDIVTRQLDLTEPLKERIDSKIGHVIEKLGSLGVASTNVVLRVHKNSIEEKHAQTTKRNSQIAECTVVLKGGLVIHTSDRSEDMYASIDLVAHKMATRLKKITAKKLDKKQNEKIGGNVTEDEEFDDEELLQELSSEDKMRAMSIVSPLSEKDVRKKVFEMPPISLSEAISSLELIDHPFFVFRNLETKEVNVVYKKDSGGVGVISPQSE
mmetsp:Transcript_25715/g.24574  ORF Transcript_25715/g.24574 Transcript_25715/m.24574 type:complete len:250 (+) Transcript_25715:130-879(+)